MTNELKEFLINEFEIEFLSSTQTELTEFNLVDLFEDGWMDEFEITRQDRESYRWWDEVEVICEINGRYISYWWAEANRDESVQDLGWSFDINYTKFVKPVETIIIKYK